jgi:hypothetical protein
METHAHPIMFLDCPAYRDKGGSARCGRPAAVEYRYAIESADGPIECAKIRCPEGHWFNGSIESMTRAKSPRFAGTRDLRPGR